MLRDDISYADFKRKFLTFYWGAHNQDELRNKLMIGKFDPGGKLDHEKLLLRVRTNCSSVRPPLSISDTIDIALRHSPSEVINALVVARPSTFEETVALLRQLKGRSGIYRPWYDRREGDRNSKTFPKAEVNVFQSERRAGSPNYNNQPYRPHRNEYQALYDRLRKTIRGDIMGTQDLTGINHTAVQIIQDTVLERM